MERISYHYQYDLPLRNRHFVDLNPLEVGSEQQPPGRSIGFHTRQHYLIHYVLSGKGCFLTNGTQYEVKAGEFFLIRPDDITLYVADEEDPWHYVWVGFDGTLAQKFHLLPTVNKMGPELWKEIRQMLIRNFAGWEGMEEEYIVVMLHRIMAELFAGRRPVSKSEAHYASRVRTYIETSYAQNITVQGIADMLSMDRRYLTRLFKSRYGITIQEYLLKMRLENAARLLLAGHSVSESAALSGYRERSHFSRMFHQHFGEWPQEYAQNRK